MRTLTCLALAAALALLGCTDGAKTETPKPSTQKAGKALTTAERFERYDASLRRAATWILAQQRKDGVFAGTVKDEVSTDVGKTALALSALLTSPDVGKLRQDAEVKKAAAFLVQSAQDDGSINPTGVRGLANYQTAAALTALSALNDPAHAAVREKAKQFLLSIQNKEGVDAGSWGYNSSQRGDVSNTQFALEALKAAGLDEKSEAFQNCVQFLQRCQNRSESNDQEWAGNDGGGVYYPGSSKAGVIELPDGKTIYKSYGSMTYALLRGYALCGIGTDDARVQAAQKWIADNYALDANPGMPEDRKLQGLYYYFLSMAKALRLLGGPVVVTPDGTKLEWARDLGDKLVELQAKDGSWVNEAMRWMENDRLLATGYAMLALSECRAALADAK